MKNPTDEDDADVLKLETKVKGRSHISSLCELLDYKYKGENT